MSYEVKTPALARVIEDAFRANQALDSGTVERGDVAVKTKNLGIIVQAVAGDVKARLAAPKIAAFEAKLIEAERLAPKIAPAE